MTVRDERGFLSCASLISRDSRRNLQAKKILMTQSEAAARPGPREPNLSAADPSAGPIATPTLVAADNQPSALALLSGSTESATYAWITPTVPPPAPCTSRDNNSSQIVCANGKTTDAIPAAVGRR